MTTEAFFGIMRFSILSGGTDSAPTSPAAARLMRLSKAQSGNPTLTLFCLNGTTITAVPWVFDESGSGVWVPVNAAVTATPASPAVISIPRIDRAKLFWQVTANTGVTEFGHLYN